MFFRQTNSRSAVSNSEYLSINDITFSKPGIRLPRQNDEKSSPLKEVAQGNITYIHHHNINDKSAETGNAALHILASNVNFISTLKNVLYLNPDVKITNKVGNTPLHIAAAVGNFEAVKNLVSSGADVNSRGQYHKTPLHIAAVNGFLEIAEFLIKNGAEVDPKGHKISPIVYAVVQRRNHDMIKFLLARGAIQTLQSLDLLIHYAMQNSDPAAVKILIQNRNSFDGRDYSLILHWAIRINNRDLIESLLSDPSIDVNKIDEDGNAPVHCAFDTYSTYNNSHKDKSYEPFNLIYELAQRKANMKSSGIGGVTLLHFAAFTNNLSLIETFFPQGSEIDSNLEENYKIKMEEYRKKYYGRHHHFTLLSHLIEKNGRTPLHVAIGSRNLEIAKYLVERGADIGIKSNNRTTALHCAAEIKAKEFAEFLIRSGSKIDAKDEMGKTPLHIAAYQSASLEINVVGSSKPVRCEDGDLEMIKLLFAFGANPNMRDNFGNTPLHYAAKHGHKYAVRSLIEGGADVEAQNNEGKIPIDFLEEKEAVYCNDETAYIEKYTIKIDPEMIQMLTPSGISFKKLGKLRF